MIKNSPKSAKTLLLAQFNKILERQAFQKNWKKHVILAFLKKGKDANEAENYRPIVLQSCVQKIFENITKSKIE